MPGPFTATPCGVLRHAAVSTWLNGGVPPTQVAEWAGHSVAVLLRVYAKCIAGSRATSHGNRSAARSDLDEHPLAAGIPTATPGEREGRADREGPAHPARGPGPGGIEASSEAAKGTADLFPCDIALDPAMHLLA